MQKAEWIWITNDNNKDQYVHFFKDFDVNCIEEIILKIAIDTNYTAYINGKLAAFGQYADFPHYKVYDSIDITKFIKKGKNRLAICGYYCGEDFMTCYKGNAGLIFEITENGNILSSSDSNTKCRLATDYISGKQIKITGQLNYSYCYDMNGYDGWNKEDFNFNNFCSAQIISDISKDLHIRPIKKLILGKRADSKLIKSGSYEYCGGKTEAEKQQKADILFSNINDNKISVNNGGVYALYDLGQEEVGFLNIKIKIKKSCKISIGYGEHITDGRVRTYIHGRNFAVEYIAKEGEQEFLNTFLRFGCRYLQIFAETNSIEIEYLTICPAFYPLQINEFKVNNSLRQQIYDVSIRTLQLCMHEHYEDCPWREQGLYTMDSRNQMLCGYYAFSEKEFARASLKLIGLDNCKDGLLSICYPSNIDLKIPSFSLYYFIQMREYIEYSNDLSLAREIFPKLELILNTFIIKLNKDFNLVPLFSGNKSFWNFYEWQEGLCGNLYEEDEEGYDVILNSLLSLALQNMIIISKALKKEDNILKYDKLILDINEAINKHFYDNKKGIFKTDLSNNQKTYSVLANSLVILCGAANCEKQIKIAQMLEQNNSDIIDVTLSMSCFKYDALLKTDKEKYASYVLSDIDKKYEYMLKMGATSFWETIKGESDFDGAGSLCHGWSAIPVYYYHILKDYL